MPTTNTTNELQVPNFEEQLLAAQRYIGQQEEIMAARNLQISRLSIENQNLRSALGRKEVSDDLMTDELLGRYIQAAHRVYADDEGVFIDDNPEVVVDPTGARVSAWVKVSAVQAGVEEESVVLPSFQHMISE